MYFLAFLKEKERFSLNQLPLDLQVEVLKREQKKALKEAYDGAKEFRQRKSLHARINMKLESYFAYRDKHIQGLKRLSYLYAYLIENLQEFDKEGNNVTYNDFPNLQA